MKRYVAVGIIGALLGGAVALSSSPAEASGRQVACTVTTATERVLIVRCAGQRSPIMYRKVGGTWTRVPFGPVLPR